MPDLTRRSLIKGAALVPLAKTLGGERMPGNPPVLTLVSDQPSYKPGSTAALTLTITDKDNVTEPLTTSGTDALGLDVTVAAVTTRKEGFQVRWTVDGVAQPDWNDDLLVAVPIPTTAKAGVPVVVTAQVTDRQKNVVSQSLALQVVAPVRKLELGCAIAAAPNGKNRQTRWSEFVATTASAPRRLQRAYAGESATAKLLALYEADPTRTDLWQQLNNLGVTVGQETERSVLLSVKVVLDDCLAGRYDGLLRALATQYKGQGKLRITTWHEPYDNVVDGSLDLAKWRSCIARFVSVLAPFDHVQVWVVLTGEQFENQFVGTAKDPDRFYVPGVYGVAGDRYNVPSIRHDGTPWWTSARMFDPYSAWCRNKNVAPGLWEYGAFHDDADPDRRSRDMINVRDYCAANGYEVLSWFDAPGPKGPWFVDLIVHLADPPGYYPAQPVGSVVSVAPDGHSADTWHMMVSQS